MQATRGRGYSSYSFLTSALDGIRGQRHAPAAFYPREWTTGIHWTGGWVELSAGLDTQARGKILCICRGWNPGRPVCSPTLYWPRYFSSLSCLLVSTKYFLLSSSLLKKFSCPKICSEDQLFNNILKGPQLINSNFKGLNCTIVSFKNLSCPVVLLKGLSCQTVSSKDLSRLAVGLHQRP
jgi:hypothetical protein